MKEAPLAVTPTASPKPKTKCVTTATASEINQQLGDFPAATVDLLMVRLVEIGQQATVAAANTASVFLLLQQIRVTRRNRSIHILEVHQTQCGLRHLVDCLSVINQAREHAGAAFRCLVGKDCTAVVPRRQRFTEDFAFFQLENHFNSAQQRMLNRRDSLRLVLLRLFKAEQQGILSVANNRDNANRLDHVGRNVRVAVLIVGFRPVSGSRIDVETEDSLVLSALQALV